MVFGRFHCPKCGIDNFERYPISEFDYVCANGHTTRYNVVSQSEVSFICPVCMKEHNNTEFNLSLAALWDKDLSYLVAVI
jgi:predicted nucleic-acid-binding Zn-ribbon protein